MTTVANRQEHDDSGEYSDASQDIEHNNSGNDAGQHESDYDSQGSDSEHSDGDPDKQEAERRVDDDEDRSNPQYIPKRGTFYEHDDRTAASGEESNNTTSETVSEKEGPETPAERRRPPRKSETLNKWSHDKYNENEQMPKSRDELVAIYGYDIRNEDAPPHARRNRRYGRGPNKYTRTWEDEEAYKRQAGAQPPKKPPSPADFPELGAANKPGRRTRAPRPRSKSQPTSNDSSENGSQLRRNASIKATKPNKPKPVNKPLKPMKDVNIPLENLTITTTVNNNSQENQRKVNSSIAQQKPVSTEQVKKKLTPTQYAVLQTAPQNNAAQNKPQAPAQQKPQTPKSQQQLSQQPTAAGAESRGGSKRYSSLRQRPLAETYSPQQQPQQNSQQPQQQTQQQQHRFHANDYVAGTTPATQHQGSPGPIHPQQMLHQQQVHRNSVSQTPHGPSPPHQQLPQPPHNQPQLRLLEQQQIVSHPHHTIHNIPQQHSIGQIPPAQGYAPPAMMPTQYMQQGGNNAVFAGAPMYQPPAAYAPHQLYQHHNYAQAGGVTYYSCAEQEQPPRAQRRPTAAIPIVRPAAPQPPPANAERSANSSDKDIDRIVENMFVRKPYKSPNEGDALKDKQERSSQEPQSKESSQPNSLTSSSISTDSKHADRTEQSEETDRKKESEVVSTETITTDA